MKAIVGATLIDGTGQPPLENAAVVTGASGRIEEPPAPRRAVAIPPDAEVIRGDGMTLMPGLIDCHDHLTSHGYNILGRWEFGKPQSLRHIQTAAVLEKVLRSGYTTIRDAGWMDAGHKMAVEQGTDQGAAPGTGHQPHLSHWRPRRSVQPLRTSPAPPFGPPASPRHRQRGGGGALHGAGGGAGGSGRNQVCHHGRRSIPARPWTQGH